MAYKFQLGDARLSGSVVQEGDISAEGTTLTGDITMTGAGDTALDVASDSLYFRDADGTMKRDTMADIMTAVAGNGLAASSGVLAVGVDDSSIELNSDALRIKAAGVTNAMLAGSIANSKLSNNSVTVTAGDGLSGGGNVALGATISMAVDMNEFTAATVDVAADSIAIIDADDSNGTKKESIADLVSGFAGYTNGGLGAASGQLVLDMNDLSDVAVDVAADFFGFVDAGNGMTRKESIADLMTAVAGNGLAASSGVLAVGVDDSSIELDSDALRIKAAGVTNAMLAGSIADGKLNQITTGDKVAGSAVQLAGTSALEDSTGLRLKSAVAGNGLALASQVLAVQVSGAIHLDSDKVGLSGSIAGNGLTYSGPEAHIKELSVQIASNAGLSNSPLGLTADLNGLAAAAVDVAADSIAIIDADDTNGSRKESIADLMTAAAGSALAASSGVLAVQVNSTSLQIASDEIQLKSTVAGDGLALSSHALAVDLASTNALQFSGGQLELKNTIAGARTFSSNVTISGDLTVNGTTTTISTTNLDVEDKLIKIASGSANAGAAAGAGLFVDGASINWMYKQNGEGDAASSGDIWVASGSAGMVDIQAAKFYGDLVGVVQATVATIGDAAATLAQGYNVGTASLSAARIWTLPTSPAVGDVVHVKAPGNTSASLTITIARAGSQTVDGSTSIVLESPYAAVSLVYAANNTWVVF